MAHGENAARKHNQRKEMGSKRAGGLGWMARGWWTKWWTHRLERRQAQAEIRREMEATDG